MPFIQPTIGSILKDIKLTGKMVIITGASAGIGLEAARQYLLLGEDHVVLAA